MSEFEFERNSGASSSDEDDDKKEKQSVADGVRKGAR